MNNSSISDIFSQSKPLRQRIDYLQRNGLSPEVAFREAKAEYLHFLSHENPTVVNSRFSCRGQNKASSSSLWSQGLTRTASRLVGKHSHSEQPDKTVYKSEEVLILFNSAFYGIGAVVCTGALFYYGAKSCGGNAESWFWSILIVASSTILISLTFNKNSFKSWAHKALGLGILCLGYYAMHAAITENREKVIFALTAGSSEVVMLQKQINDFEQRLSPTRRAIENMDPVKFRTAITKLQQDTKPLEDELTKTRVEFINSRKTEAAKATTGSASRQSFVEWMRRLMLEPLNILCVHGFIEGLPELMKVLRRRSFRLAGASL